MTAKTPLTIILILLVAGCSSTDMYTYDGYLTEYGGKQTAAEYEAINVECNKHDKLESDRYKCKRQLLPLRLRYDEVFAEIMEDWLTASYNVALGYEAANISEETAQNTLEELRTEYSFEFDMLNEQFKKNVASRNSREKQLARQRTGMALRQLGSDLLQQSENNKSVTCMETLPGVVECSEW